MKKIMVFVLAAILLAVVTGCTADGDIEVTTPDTTIRLTVPNPNPLANEPDDDQRIAGLLQGLWHGLIAPITLIMSFFNPGVGMYEVHNDGRPYDIGFLLGVAIVFAVLGITGGRRR